jgi:hypothetical protein
VGVGKGSGGALFQLPLSLAFEQSSAAGWRCQFEVMGITEPLDSVLSRDFFSESEIPPTILPELP